MIKSSWRIECNICDASFTSKISLNRHIVSVHEGKKPFKCDICNASFSENNYLNRHIEAVHDKNKPFKSKFMHCGNFILEMSAYFWDYTSWHTAQMAAIIMKPSWSPKLSNGAFITTMKNQTCFGENLQFSFKQKVFKPNYSVGKTFSFSSKQKEIQIVQLD